MEESTQNAPSIEQVLSGLEQSSDNQEVLEPQEGAETLEAQSETETEPQKPELSAEEKAKEERFAQKFAALSRKEKAIREREKAIEKRIKELESKQPELEKTASQAREEAESFKRSLKTNPLKALEQVGLTFEQLAQLVLNDGKPTAEMMISEKEREIQSKIDALEQRLKAKEEAEEQQKLDAAINGFKAQIEQEIANNSTTYELIQAENATGLVYDVIASHHEETGEILDIKAAADAVEEYLFEEAKKRLNVPKIKSVLQPSPTQQNSASPAVKPGQKTLTNSSATKATAPVSRKLSNEEALIEAAKLIKWE